MFDNRTGRVELRGIALATSGLNETIPADVMPLKELIAAGGKGPKVLQEVKPLYTPEAMRAIAQGVVTVDAVIMADGSVSATRVARSLRPDLDASALAALKAWRFEPAVLDGKPVATLAQVEMSFRLK